MGVMVQATGPLSPVAVACLCVGVLLPILAGPWFGRAGELVGALVSLAIAIFYAVWLLVGGKD